MAYTSLTDVRLLAEKEVNFVYFENYARLLDDPRLNEALFNTVIIVPLAIAVEFLFGFGIALSLGRRGHKGENVILDTIVIPYMVPIAVAAQIWVLFFSTNYGVANYLASLLGIGKMGWLGDTWLARLSVIIADAWTWTPFIFLCLLAGLRSIPEYLYEAANLDGLSGWSLFRNVTFPMLRPVITVALMIRFIDALKIFDSIFILTKGGPAFSTSILPYYIYQVAFQFGRLGYGAAMSFLLFALSMLSVFLFLKAIKLPKHLGWEK